MNTLLLITSMSTMRRTGASLLEQDEVVATEQYFVYYAVPDIHTLETCFSCMNLNPLLPAETRLLHFTNNCFKIQIITLLTLQLIPGNS